MVEADEVLQDVDEPFPAEDSFEECLIVDDLHRLSFSIPAFPLHETVGLSRQCSGLGSQHVAGHAEGVIDEQRRALLLILLDLQIVL